MMQYKDVVREMFARHKGQPAKDVMRMAAAEWQAIKAGKKPAKAKGRKARGGAIDPMSIASGVSAALPVVGDLVSGISDLFSSKPDPDKQLARDYALREYNRINGTRYGVEGTHWNVPYGAGLRKGRKTRGAGLFGDIGHGVDSIASLFGMGLDKPKGRKARGGAVSAGNLNGYRTLGGYVSGGAASGGAVSAGNVAKVGKLASGLRGMGGSGGYRAPGSMNRGGSVSGGASGGAVSAGSLGDILSSALPFMSLL